MKHFDVVVIGSGPSGEAAAMTCAKGGRKVCVIDRNHEIGGGCVHWGTIPSKMLRHSVQEYVNFRKNPMFRRALDRLDMTFPLLLEAAHGVISQQLSMRRNFYERNHVELFDGHGRFIDAHTLEVHSGDDTRQRISADHFVVAVGTSPYQPDDIDFDHPRVLDANTVLQLEETPQTLTIYGAGVIGCEYTSIFRGLGLKVNLINTRDRLLSFLDDEISDALSYHLRDQGTLIRHQEEYDCVETQEDGVVLHLQSGKRIKTEYLLWATGRAGNTDGLGLENVGVEINKRKQLDVNMHYQTNVDHIYAVGDVVGLPGLASASYDQGRFAGTHIVDGTSSRRLLENIPSGIYTSPEISSVGPTERELTQDQIPYEVGHAFFRNLARAQIVDCRVGMLKLLFHVETFEILAIHCFGYQASEIVHIGQAIMEQTGGANDIRYFTQTTFNYPTMAEAYRVAALNGLNRIVD